MNLSSVRSTSSMPLMLNFVKPVEVEVVKAEEIAVVYDPVSQMTMFMGGGSSNQSKSQVSTKQTLCGMTGSRKEYKADHEYGYDD